MHDLVQGEVTVNNSEMDDLIILRSDGTPTYLHAVVVDDHDMEITHVIRGDDHLTNSSARSRSTTRWIGPYRASATCQLIHGADGASCPSGTAR